MYTGHTPNRPSLSNGHVATAALSQGTLALVDSPRRVYRPVKGALDWVFAFVLLVLTAPLLLLLAALVKLTSRGPAVYAQIRLGRHGRPYTLYKLRTMTSDAERAGAQWAIPGDPRVTRFGRFLRKTHLDELPQLWNVIRGDMSVVGPRPERPEFVPGLSRALPGYRDRLAVKPGVTGLAQVRLPADTDLDSVRRKVAYDLYYIRQMTFGLDARIVLATALKMAGVPFPVLAALFRLPSRPALAGQRVLQETSDSDELPVLRGRAVIEEASSDELPVLRGRAVIEEGSSSCELPVLGEETPSSDALPVLAGKAPLEGASSSDELPALSPVLARAGGRTFLSPRSSTSVTLDG